jgi:hypothetical protein
MALSDLMQIVNSISAREFPRIYLVIKGVILGEVNDGLEGFCGNNRECK